MRNRNTKDHKFAGSEFGRQRRFREAQVTTRDGRDQSSPLIRVLLDDAGGLGSYETFVVLSDSGG